MQIAAQKQTPVFGKPDSSHRSDDRDRIDWLGALPIMALHIGAFGLLFIVPFSWTGVALCIVTHYVRMWALSSFSHRYFSHRSFKAGRGFQFFMALMSTLTVQNGVLWWAANHRHHHKYSDKPEDLHSPAQKGFWWSHMGWLFTYHSNETMYDQVRDLMKYPEIVWLHNHWRIPVVLSALAFYAVGGWFALYWGFFLGVAVFHHCTFTVNSVAHIWGKRRYQTSDTSRNNFWIALITMGEGWHNNHHHYQSSARQGFFWWEIDMSYYILKGLEKIGLVWDVRQPPEHVKLGGRPGK